jgi:signal transduction histidine kinase
MGVIVTLRWVLIIAIAYLLLFSRPLGTTPVSVAIFVALYLGSNVVLTELARRESRHAGLEWAVVILDIAAVTLALYLCGSGANELFVLYFGVLFLSALLDGVLMAVGAALLIGTANIYTASAFMDAGELVRHGYVVRLPFLFAVALFFGNLVQNARARERQVRDSALRAQRMELLSTVSHDLRNPLGVIDSLAELLMDGDAGQLNQDQLGLLRRIRVSIRQVLHLSNNLIDAERIELDHFTLRPEECDLREIVDEALVIAATAAQIKGVRLSSQLPLRARLRADAVQIERAVSNLLGNAIKFTPRGGTVSLTLRNEPTCVRIEITDSGPGFPETLLGDLGRKHLLGADARNTGSGLGLFIADAVMKAHGGWLSAENGAGGGAKVALNLPAEPEAAALESELGEPCLAKAG